MCCGRWRGSRVACWLAPAAATAMLAKGASWGCSLPGRLCHCLVPSVSRAGLWRAAHAAASRRTAFWRAACGPAGGRQQLWRAATWGLDGGIWRAPAWPAAAALWPINCAAGSARQRAQRQRGSGERCDHKAARMCSNHFNNCNGAAT